MALKLKTYHKKTRKGTIVKVVREHYLREDIPCGITNCELCGRQSASCASSGGDSSAVFDLASVSSASAVCSAPHLIILDPGILLNQSDIIEDDAFTNAVIPQTSWEEVKHRSPPAYKKMKDFVFGNDEKRFFVFLNEFHRDTYVERRPKETAEDRTNRAIRTTLRWYSDHLKKCLEKQKSNDVRALLLSDNPINISLCQEEGLLCFSLADYVKNIPGKPTLIDKLASGDSADNKLSTRGKVLFPEHRTLSDLQSGLREGRYKQGSFQVSRDNYLEAYVYAEENTDPVFIQGLLNCNRAVHDDIVAIQMLPEEEWTMPARLLKIRDLEEIKAVSGGATVDTGDDVDPEEDMEIKEASDVHSAKDRENILPSAKVVGIIRRNWRPYCGLLMKSPIPGARRHLFVPAEKRVPHIRIETRQAEILEGQRLVVSVDCWPRESRYPKGHFVKSLGPLGDKDTENEVLLLEHDIPHAKFSQGVLNCLPTMPWLITEEDRASRTDLRHLDICSVDPPGCTDIDDALHCRELEKGKLEVGVHIADVSHFVRPDTDMDKEAASRGTTVYLVDQRIDMLPELLSSNLCSLRGGEERFAFSVIWELTPDGEILSKAFCKSIILSRAALTYAEAQMKIDDKKQNDPVSRSLRMLNDLAKKLRRKRKGKGALSLASLEIRFNVDSETHDPIDVQEKKVLETNSMIEEFMLLANITVAERISQEYPDCAVLRRHPVPAPSSYKPVIQAASSRGFKITIDSGKSLAESLDSSVLKGNPFFNTMLRILTTRCMTQALYFASGTLEPKHYVHFGLASHIYTHFTSPIRRYADLMVHRLLSFAMKADSVHPNMLNQRKIQEQCNNMNYRHKMAQYAGRASVLLNTHLYFKEKVEDLEGYVLMIRKNAFQVLIPKYGLESAVLLGSDSPLAYNEQEGILTSKQHAVTLRMFDRVTVQLSLDKRDAQHHKLRLQLVEPKVPGFSVEPLFHVPEPPVEAPPLKRKKSYSEK